METLLKSLQALTQFNYVTQSLCGGRPLKQFQADIRTRDEGLTLETLALKLFMVAYLFLLFNSVVHTKLSCYTLPSTSTTLSSCVQTLIRYSIHMNYTVTRYLFSSNSLK